MHSTLKNFKYPGLLIKEYNNWVLLLRSEQCTLGALVLVYKKKVRKLSLVSLKGFEEMKNIVDDIENIYKKIFRYQKINYLALMMKDKEVHFHILPRYKNVKTFLNKKFYDKDWPKKHSLENHNPLTKSFFNKMKKNISKYFLKNKKKYKRVLTTGTFDFLHHGHLNILKKSKEIADELIVGVSTDKHVRSYKGKSPSVPLNERLKIVSSINYVDKVIIQKDKNKNRLIKKYKIDAITVGSDWKGKYPKVNCKLIFFPYTKNISSTKIKKDINDNKKNL
jgi:glycerol-3-phosphate cytidylyltransferase